MTYILPDALRPLANYAQFILWCLEDRGEPKLAKIPFDPMDRYDMNTGQVKPMDAQNPANWMNITTAEKLAGLHDCGVGFVLTDHDPFFCIDLDAQLMPDGTWSEWSQQMVQFFPGAALEISFSNNGLHIFGTARITPGHRTRSAAVAGLEVYSNKRFIALGHDAMGDASTDHTTHLQAIIDQYFPDDAATAPTQWTNAPVDEWSGPADDDELIRRMLASGERKMTAAQVFDGAEKTRATLQDLWMGDVGMIAATYPSTTGKPFDHSSADAALIAHLAFWTGKDCERMDRLFRMSKLVRPKWIDRQKYRQDTILGACGRCGNVYQRSEPGIPVTGHVEPGRPGMAVTYKEGYQLLLADQQVNHFAGCVYIQDIHRVFTLRGSLLKPEQFKAWFGGYVFALDSGSTKTTKDAWEAFTQSQVVNFPKAESLCFRPRLPPGACIDEEGRSIVNTYVPANVRMIPGDVTPFLDHMKRLVPDDRDRLILLSYSAAVVQYPGVKFQWCPVIQGVEGNGKSLLVRCLTKAVGERYTHLPDASDIAGKFNGWLRNKLFIGVDEIHFKGNQEIVDKMKKMVTDDRVDIQAKGVDQVTGDNVANWMMTTNYKDAVIKSRDGRRYCIFFTVQQKKSDMVRDGMTGRYFPELYTWLVRDGYAHVAHFLATMPIPDEFNPATLCQYAPDTTSTQDAIIQSMGRAEQLIQDAIDSEKTGFRGGWISSVSVNGLLTSRNIRISQVKQHDMLDALGYVPYPHTVGGRAPRIVTEEGGLRPILYMRVGVGLDRYATDVVTDIYRQAQGWIQ